jgi:hypothetical protein
MSRRSEVTLHPSSYSKSGIVVLCFINRVYYIAV